MAHARRFVLHGGPWRNIASWYGVSEMFNSDQSSQFTSEEFTAVLVKRGIAISMDGKGWRGDNVFVERSGRA